MQELISADELIKAITGISKAKKVLTIESGMNIYLEYVRLHKKPATLSQYTSCFLFLKPFLERYKVYNLNDVNYELINEYQRFCKQNSKLCNKTINKRIKVLVACYNYCLKREFISGNYLKYESLPEVKKVIKPISKTDMKKALDYIEHNASKSNKLLFKLMLTTGIRTEECSNIKNCNIDFNKKLITLTDTKNSELGYISFATIEQDLKEVYDPNFKYLFHKDSPESKITAVAIKSFYARIKRQLDLEYFNPHRIRHFYGTELYKKTGDIYFVSKCLRHKSIEITKIYLDISDSEILKNSDLLSPLKDL